MNNTFSASPSRSWPGISWRSTSSWRWAELVPPQRTSLRKWCGWKRATRGLSSWTCSVLQVRRPHSNNNSQHLDVSQLYRYTTHKIQPKLIILQPRFQKNCRCIKHTQIKQECNDLKILLAYFQLIHYKGKTFNAQTDIFCKYTLILNLTLAPPPKTPGTGASLPLCFISFSFNNTHTVSVGELRTPFAEVKFFPILS